MNESQKIVFNMALDYLDKAIPRKRIVTGAAFGFHKDKDGNPLENEYQFWAKESDLMEEEIREAIRLLKIIKHEILNP